MTLLITGATGKVGRNVVDQLLQRGANVRALVRDPVTANLPAAVTLMQGDMLDVASMRNACSGISTLFLLCASGSDEFTRALVTLNVAREAGIKRIVYLSVIHCDLYVDVPQFAAKYCVERMIEQVGFSATILRPAYYFANDLTITDMVVDHGLYPIPIGSRGLAMIDERDIAEIAAMEIIRRDQSAGHLPTTRINLVGPDVLTGAKVASIWSEVLGRRVIYGGDDTRAFEKSLRKHFAPWMAFDLRLMSERFLTNGMLPGSGDLTRLSRLLKRPLRSYRDFATEVSNTSEIKKSSVPKLLVLGATGVTGQHIVRQALARGYDVTAVVRSVEKVKDIKGARWIVGDVLDPSVLRQALIDRDVVISALGTGASPFREVSFLSTSTRALVDAMKAQRVPRLICITGIGAGDSAGHGGFAFDNLIFPLLLRKVYADKNRQEQIVRGSGLEWVVVRPAILNNKTERGAVRALTNLSGFHGGTISRADVANFVLDQVRSNTWLHQSPLITS